MSASPAEKADVDQGDSNPENSEQMERGDTEGARDAAYNEFDVKEQDRWLPIANGWLPRCFPPFAIFELHLFCTSSHCHIGNIDAELEAQEMYRQGVYLGPL